MFKSKLLNLVMLIAFFTLFLINCGCDNPASSLEDSLLGTWFRTKVTITTPDWTQTITSDEIALTMTFNSDHTYNETAVFGQGGATFTDTGTWSLSGSTLTYTDSDGEITTGEMTIQGKNMTHTESDATMTVVHDWVKQ